MSLLIDKALKAGAWYTGVNFASQVLSWFFTIYVARLLYPVDYGLMAMAAFFTAQLERFSEMGFGVAIIQSKEVSDNDLSSIFWFLCLVGTGFSVVTLFLAYPTVIVFNEPKLKFITMLIAPLFLAGAVAIVPLSIMKRKFAFKTIGIVDFIAMVFSSIVTIAMARSGHGVYSLIAGLIVLRTTKSVLIYLLSGWKPKFYFKFSDVRPFLSFGLKVIMSGVLLRSMQSIDKLIVGRYFDAIFLGVYGFGMDLASIPAQKIWPIFNQLLLSTLSRIQADKKQLESVVLSTLQYFLYLITPLLFGGSLFAKELILGILGEKWAPGVVFFQAFCFSQFFFLVGTYLTVVNNSIGKPHYNLLYNFISSILMLIAIFLSATMAQSYILLPWTVLLPIIIIIWLGINLRLLNISLFQYLFVFLKGTLPGCLIVGGLFGLRTKLFATLPFELSYLSMVFIEVGIGILLYTMYFVIFQKEEAKKLYSILKK